MKPKKSTYATHKPGTWLEPVRKGYKLGCCDCGLVHMIDFRLVKNRCGSGKKIQFLPSRDERATAQYRRWHKITVRHK
jgi:hypothetical protein